MSVRQTTFGVVGFHMVRLLESAGGNGERERGGIRGWKRRGKGAEYVGHGVIEGGREGGDVGEGRKGTVWEGGD